MGRRPSSADLKAFKALGGMPMYILFERRQLLRVSKNKKGRLRIKAILSRTDLENYLDQAVALAMANSAPGNVFRGIRNKN